METIITNQNEIPTQSEILFKPKQTTAQINIETLSNSATHMTVSGNLPPSRPIHHYQFLEWMQQEFEDSFGEEVILDPIYISARHAARIKFSPEEIINPKEPCPIERLNIQRLVTRMRVEQFTTIGGDKFNPAFGISYTDKGIEVVFGTNVWACQNMNIFGTDRWSTYGSNKLHFEDFKTLVKDKLRTWGDSYERNLDTILKLQSTDMPLDVQRKQVAMLFESAVQNNYAKKKDYILNITQTVKLQEEILAKRIGLQTEQLSWWDFTQAGTENLKPDRQDMVSLYPTVQNFNNYVIEQCELA
jgi:hypothetical protein